MKLDAEEKAIVCMEICLSTVLLSIAACFIKFLFMPWN